MQRHDRRDAAAVGLFHDEPTIEFLNYAGVDTVGVGNHEFDEGKDELRMQYGNQSHDGGGANTGTAYTPFRPTAAIRWTAAPGRDAVLRLRLPVPGGERHRPGAENPLLPAYDIVNTSTGEKIAFIGETLKGRR